MQEGHEDSGPRFGEPPGLQASPGPVAGETMHQREDPSLGYFKMHWQSCMNPPGKLRALAMVR